jgi:hypothetical protein
MAIALTGVCPLKRHRLSRDIQNQLIDDDTHLGWHEADPEIIAANVHELHRS